ncbi:hypothetical protein CA13_63310 [Planctomycetes bacterium CA13]|uniref:Sialate O-acetylesterase domain-containing protein n=1 Tax=Novipirellula herctigrandis TaxID=2527986 RepID=A0A5C5ZCF7_9BACT|nr:hypothetical protein CA13_63310 [Planctomycetes bacterium CA13]
MKRSSFLFLCHCFAMFGFAILTSASANAEARLPGFFNDHMVLQQQMPIRVWGWAAPGEEITISLGGKSVTTKASEEGTWKTELPAMQATASGQVLLVQASNAIEVNDVLIGEVWLCSGQSNMEWTVNRTENADVEIVSANHPLIRHVKIGKNQSMELLSDVNATWQVCSPETVGQFTAAGYFMAKELAEKLDVPIGLINSSWGGTRIEPWTTAAGFQPIESLRDIYASVQLRNPGSETYQDRMSQHISETETWLGQAKTAFAAKTSVPVNPAFPVDLMPFQSHQDPTMLYNAMIHPLVGYGIRGAIWYQGESNHGEGMLYADKMNALIEGWREVWDQGDFPFYYVQIAPFQYGNEDSTILPRFWEAQAAAQSIPNTGMVVINDIATLGNIHPPNKLDVGRRLALLALKNDYGQTDLVARSPEMESISMSGDELRIQFKYTGGVLKTRDGNVPSHFEIISKFSGGFHPADAKIDGDVVVLSSSKVKQPVAFRYAWDKLAEPNLTGATGLPVSAFQGGKTPDFSEMIPGLSDYQLVYDLDLAKLQRDITYDVDHAADVKSFDRVGYLLELNSSDFGTQKVFVSMEAFTDDASQIGLPTMSSSAKFQTAVSSMDVFSSTDDVVTGTSIQTGNIEFWPSNYGPDNGGGIKDASSSVFDFGDQPGPPQDGYGSMQIHNHAAKQTIFAINKWNAGANADIGIGNSQGETRDWTFTSSGPKYSTKRLRVFVRATP